MEKEDRRLPIIDEKRFAILTKESIRLIAEAGGHADLPDDVAALLGEDVSYRLREAAQNGAQYMKHAKRKKMTTDDFNKSLKVSDIQPVHGYRSPENLPFRQTKDGELFFVEDTDTNFANVAFSNYIPKNPGETSIKAHWLAVEGVSKVSSALHQNLIKPIIKREDLQMYFDNVTNAILGCDPDAMKIALQDLKTNSQIVPLLPRFVSFVANGVKTVSHDICQLTKLLHTVKALINNTSLYLEPQPYLNMVVQGTTYCLLEPLAASINPSNDHWALRDYAARLLAQIIMSWSSPINHLLYNTVKNLKEVLCDHAKPFCCHYGAVMGLTALGYKSVEEVLIPHLPVYWPHLTSVLDDTSYANAITKSDAHKVHGAMLLAVEFVMKKHIRMFEEQVEEYENNKMEFSFRSKEQVSPSKTDHSAASQLQLSVSQLYTDMYSFFGDSLAIRLPDLCEKIDLKGKVFVGKKQEKTVSLTDPESAKSGDELLAEFMEQVRIQEILDKERREREKIENARLEVLRKEREEQERILREKQERIDRVKQAEQDKQAQELELLRQHHMRRSAELLEIEKQRHKDMLNQTKKDLRVLKKPSYKEVDTDDEEELSDDGRRRAVKIPQLPPVNREVKVEEEEDANFAGPSQSHLAVSTVSDSSEGIKLKFVRRPPLKLQIKPLAVPSPPGRDQKDSKHSGKKRKQSQRTSTSASNFDAYEFIESDPEDFKQQLSFKPHYYSSEGENSDGAGHKKPLKMKLKVKDPRDFTSE